MAKIDAVFEKGVFRPVDPLSLPIFEGQRVRLTVETATSAEDIVALAGQVYEGMSDEQIAEVEKIALGRRDFFGDEGS